MSPERHGAAGAEADTASALPFRVLNAVVRLGGAASTLLILAAVCLVSYAIVQRYVFQAPLLWSDELTGYGLVALIMLGAAEAYRHGDHIAIDLVAASAGPRLSRWLGLWADLSVLIFAVVLGWSSWDSISFAYAFGSYSSGEIEIQTWIPQVPMLIGAGLLALTALARMVHRVLAGHPA